MSRGRPQCGQKLCTSLQREGGRAENQGMNVKPLRTALIVLAVAGGVGGAAQIRADASGTGDDAPAPAPAPAQKPTPTPASVPDRYQGMTDCFVFDRGSSLAIEYVARDAGAACWQGVQDAAKDGSYWSISDAPPTSVGPAQEPYCSLSRDAAEARVYDTGGAIGGQRACAALISDGWTEATG